MFSLSVVRLAGLVCLLGSQAGPDVREVSKAPEYATRLWTRADGMPQDTVNAIEQTRDGYLWIATFGGLARFDGVQFTSYTIAEHPELKTNRITALYEAGDGALWLGTERMGVVRLRDEHFESFEHGAPTGTIWDISEDAEGNLLFAGQGGISRFRDGMCEPLTATEGVAVFDMHVDSRGRLLLATHAGLRSLEDGAIESPLGEAGPEMVSVICTDPKGRIWLVGSETGLLEGDVYTRVADGPPKFPQKSIIDGRGDFWMAGDKILASLETLRAPELPAELVPRVSHLSLRDGARSFCEDSEGSLWVGTNGRGLLHVTRAPLARIDRVDWGSGSLLGSGRDGVWFQSNQGLHHVGPGDGRDVVRGFSQAELRLSGDARLLGESSDGRLWFREDRHLVVVDESGPRRVEDPDALDPLGGLLEGADGTVWLGARGGLISVRGRDARKHTIDDRDLPWRPARLSANGSLWFRGPNSVGLRTVGPEGDTFELWSLEDGLPPGEVRGVHEDERGVLWVSTYGGGLCRLKDGEIRAIGRDEGLADLSLGGILEDDRGHLWVNSNCGVLAMPRDALDAVADGTRRRAPCRVVPTGEGNGEDAHRTADGRLWFPTVNSVVIVDPEGLEIRNLPPRVRIESVLADGATHSPAEPVEIRGGVGELEFRYTGFSYHAPDQLRFSYLLEGYEKSWIDAQHRRKGFFTKVPPGRYVFRVRAEDEAGVLSEEARVEIELTPRFFQTGWFIGLCAAAAAAAVWGLHRARVLGIERHARALQREIVERERVENERRALEERLRDSAKLEALGRLTGGIAHDFNNVLTAILGRAALLAKEAESQGTASEEQLDHVKDITSCAQRAAVLTQQLLAFSRQQVLKPSVVRTNDVIAGLTPMLRQLIPENVELSVVPDDEAGHVRVDEGQLQQVVMNLVLNARDALHDGGTIAIETEAVDLGPDYVELHPEATLGPHVKIAVSDTGQGIGASVLPHVFDPFFTTKEQGHGTGLGLASVHGIVTQSGGHVLVHSETGVGTAFEVYLPRVPAATPRSEPVVAPVQELGGTETVLLCEDDEAIRRMMRMLLAPRGYTVLHAGRPLQALELARETPRIDLLITDVVMPEMSGRDLAEALLEVHPETQVLYVSGYTSDVIVHQGVVDEGIHFLDKPFTPTELLSTTRRILDARREASVASEGSAS